MEKQKFHCTVSLVRKPGPQENGYQCYPAGDGAQGGQRQGQGQVCGCGTHVGTRGAGQGLGPPSAPSDTGQGLGAGPPTPHRGT